MLTQMLKSAPNFSSFPLEKQEIYLRLADAFEDNDLALHLTPTELTNKLGLGNKQLWQEFLSLDTVKAYIKQQMAFNAQVATRKTLRSLEKEALDGNVQAAKHINELSGVLNQGDNNKVVVLHRVQRPQLKPKEDQNV